MSNESKEAQNTGGEINPGCCVAVVLARGEEIQCIESSVVGADSGEKDNSYSCCHGSYYSKLGMQTP